MFAFVTGVSPDLRTRAPVARVAALCAALAVSGCASHHQSTADAQRMNVRVADAAAAVEVEDDGLPSQTPPPARIRQAADDPTEPFSRNYGGANPSQRPISERAAETRDAPAPVKAPAPVIPADLPAAFRKQLAAAIIDQE